MGDEMKNQNKIRFEDNRGNAWNSDEVDKLTLIEVEEMGIHVAEA